MNVAVGIIVVERVVQEILSNRIKCSPGIFLIGSLILTSAAITVNPSRTLMSSARVRYIGL